MAFRNNFTIIRGDYLVFPLELSGVDLTDRTVTFIVRKNSYGESIIEKDITTHTNPTQGKTTIPLTEAETLLLLPDRKYPFWVVYVDGDNREQTIQFGHLEIIERGE